MKLYKLLVFIIVLSFYSCEYDYTVDLGEFTPKVVVNSIITPDSVVKATLVWSKHIDDSSTYKTVDIFTVKLYENNSVVFDGEGIDGVFTTTIYPKEDAKYRLEIDVPQYGKLSAETSIPLKPTVDLSYIGVVGESIYNGYFHFIIDKIILNSSTRSLMIRAMSSNTVKEIRYVRYFYANNAFCDQFNASFDTDDTGLKGSNMLYEHYLRIPYKNIHQATPLKFSIQNYELYSKKLFIDYNDFGFPIYVRIYEIRTEIIAPSKEFDKYYKSAYQQNEYVSIFGSTHSVISNIENGLGIFAGYSSASVITNIELDD